MSDVRVASPAADAGDDASQGDSERRRGRKARDKGPIAIDLEHGRWRHFGWAAGSVVVGVLLVWKLGTVGKGVGVALFVLAAFNALRFVRTLLHEPGQIRVGDDGVQLPDGLCRGATSRYEVADIRHAFFLRRALPWTQAGPVLVVETPDKVYAYPRDWFSSDSDQRRVQMAINRRLGRL